MTAAMIASALALRLASPLVLAPGAAAAAEPAEAEREPYVQLGLGGGRMWTGSLGSTPSRAAGLVFELDGGALWQLRPRLRLSLGGSLLQSGFSPELAEGHTELTSKLRIGVGDRRVWGYGIAGLGFSLLPEAISSSSSDDSSGSGFDAGLTTLGGLGVRAGIGERASIGVELTGAFSWIPPDDMLVRLSGVLLVEVRFGDSW